MPPNPNTPSMEDLIAHRTAAEKAIANAELPVMQAALAVLADPGLIEALAKLKPIVDALGPGHARNLLNQFLNLASAARPQLQQDIMRHQNTQAL